MMKHKVRFIPLENRFQQQVRLPTLTQVLAFSEAWFIPQMHVLMASDQETDDLYTIRLFSSYDAPADMTDFTYCASYTRQADQVAVHCFYKKEESP